MPTKKVPKRVVALSILSAIATCIIGIAIGWFLGRKIKPEIKSEVDIIAAAISMLSIVVTFGVAYWISHFLEKGNEENRTEKDLIIRRINQLEDHLKSCADKASVGHIPYAEAASDMKRAFQNARSIFDVLKDSPVDYDCQSQQPIEDSITNLKDLLTDTPFDTPEASIASAGLSIEVQNSIIRFHRGRILQIESGFSSLEILLFKLQMSLNRT